MSVGKEENEKFLNICVKRWDTNEGINQYDGSNLP
jgi:hypothetical protein